jgi:taurine dioxygenase
MVQVRNTDYENITATPYAPNLGAEIYGVDLSKSISDAQFADIRQAFLDHQVLFFKIRARYRQRDI